MELYLVRHGEAMSPIENPDRPLTSKGRLDVEAMAGTLRKDRVRFRKLYHSPRLRAVETAAILNQATAKSLVILDEIGRGTSTYDGLSIARSVIEHIHNDSRLGCKTLFATHYHELTQLANVLPGVRNFSVAVTEEGGDVVFLHRIIPGGADKSYGVYVARLAGLPRGVINRAWEVLADLEDTGTPAKSAGSGRSRKSPSQQMPLFDTSQPLIDEILALDVPNLTPLEAINVLYNLQQKANNRE